MPITLDAAGGLVIPKEVREAAGLEPGMQLEIRYREGRVEIEPVPATVEIVRRGSVVVAVPKRELPTLSAEVTNATLNAIREERG